MNQLDNIGLPGTRQTDGSLDMGDSAAIFFNVAALSTEEIYKIIHYFDDANEVPVRHPDKSKWWGQPDRFSRDQLIPILCWSALKGREQNLFLRKVFKAHLKHLLLYAWNSKGNGDMDMPSKAPDITFLEIAGLWLRIFKPVGYEAILWICDIETLIGSISWKFRSDRVTRNHMLVSITQRDVSPTWVSKISYKINDWKDLVSRWKAHTEAVGEYPTADLFEQHLLKEE